MAEEAHKVILNVYDLSQGLARQLSTALLGKTIEAIWHTGIVVYGKEYYFGGGIQQATVGTTPYGTPIKVVDLGETHIPKEVFEAYLDEISPRYTAETYSLLTHNCNNFTNEVASFLNGSSIPDYILNLPNEVMNSPGGAFMMPMIQQLEATMRTNAVPQAPQFRSPAVASTTTTITTTTTTTKQPESSKVVETKKIDVVKPSVVKAGEESGSGSKDSLGDAKSKVQEEIVKEFTAIMASGTLRASEAAALATRRVMQRYGLAQS